MPIVFDRQMNEYHLLFEGGGQAVMRYCFWCGGALPESRRGLLFTTPDAAEISEVTELLMGVESHEEALRILGAPDELVDSGGISVETATHKIRCRWNQHYRYAKRWKSFELQIPLVVEGRFEYSIAGHFLGKQAGQSE